MIYALKKTNAFKILGQGLNVASKMIAYVDQVFFINVGHGIPSSSSLQGILGSVGMLVGLPLNDTSNSLYLLNQEI